MPKGLIALAVAIVGIVLVLGVGIWAFLKSQEPPANGGAEIGSGLAQPFLAAQADGNPRETHL